MWVDLVKSGDGGAGFGVGGDKGAARHRPGGGTRAGTVQCSWVEEWVKLGRRQRCKRRISDQVSFIASNFEFFFGCCIVDD